MAVFNGWCSQYCACCQCVSKKRGRTHSLEEAKTMAVLSEEKIVLEEYLKPLPKYLPLTFLPDIVVNSIVNNYIKSVPYSASLESIVLMCDVCNFTRLTESYCEKGVSGIEELASIMNGYMSTLSGMMLHANGDILSFAGDAFLVQWVLPEDTEERKEVVLNAYNCALNLQAHPSLETRNLDGKLKCKIGLAIGEVTTWVLGTPNENLLFVVSGGGLGDVHTAEELCVAKDIVVSRTFFKALQDAGADTFHMTDLLNEFVKINDYHCDSSKEELVPLRVVRFQECNDSHLATAKTYLIPSIREVKTSEELSYLSEMTPVTVLFISLPEVDVGNPTVLDETFGIVLASVSKQRGCINKMLLFDKGCSYLVVFGLPGMKNPNDAARALICAHDIVVKHQMLNLTITTGVASGTCYCGLVGHSQRQEYTVIGATVNLAARLMAVYGDDPIALDEDTFHLSRDILGDQCFHELPPRKLKGVSKKGKIYGCKIVIDKVRRHHSSLADMLDTVRVMEEVGEVEPFVRHVHDCLRGLLDREERSLIHDSTLLPVLVFETQGGHGKSYFTFLATWVARKMGIRVVSSCTYVATISNPFSTAAFMVMNMLGFESKETMSQKESKLLQVVSQKWDKHLYLLNHLLEVRFPYPRFVNVDKETRNIYTFKIFQDIFNQYAAEEPVVLAVDDVDSMDDMSLQLFQALTAGEHFVLVLNIHPELQQTSLASSILILKAHTHIDVRGLAAPHFASLVCWHLGVTAVSKAIISFLRDKTGGDVKLLEEVILLPTFTKFTDLRQVEPQTFNFAGFHVSNFREDSNDQILVCDLKPGRKLEDLVIPPNINDAIHAVLNHLTVQDRLLLKRTAILGSVFDLHMLEAIGTDLTSEGVVSSINNLIKFHILCCTCTSPGMLYSVEDSPQAVKRYHVCLCNKITTQNPFYDTRGGLGYVSAYQRLKFRSHTFRKAILSYMTSEQFRKMHVEAVNNLETVGLICMSCKNRRMESLNEAAAFDMRATRVQVNLEQCACLHLRPHLFNRICIMYKKIGHNFLPAYYKKKAAQAANDLGYPIEGLIFIEKAENFLKDNVDVLKEGEAFFDLVVLRASMYKTAAKSAILLKNCYYAAFFVEKAFNILRMRTLWFYGFHSPQSFQNHLNKLSLIRSMEATKLIDVLAESYVLAEKYDLALKILKYENVALTYYPIDFMQILNYMTMLYISLVRTQPGRRFRTLEKNILATIQKRLQSHEKMVNVLEIKGIGKAQLVLINCNLCRDRLSYAEEIALESIRILMSLKDVRSTPVVHAYLAEVAIHQADFEKGFQCIQKLDLGSNSNSHTDIYYHVALSQILVQKVEEKGRSSDDEEYIVLCNEFVASWPERRIYYLNKGEMLFATACFALWALNSAKHFKWQEAQGVFQKCYSMCRSLFREQEEMSYFSIGGALTYLRVKVISKVAAMDPRGTLEELEKYKTLIEKRFLVYRKRYQDLENDINAFITDIYEK